MTAAAAAHAFGKVRVREETRADRAAAFDEAEILRTLDHEKVNSSQAQLGEKPTCQSVLQVHTLPAMSLGSLGPLKFGFRVTAKSLLPACRVCHCDLQPAHTGPTSQFSLLSTYKASKTRVAESRTDSRRRGSVQRLPHPRVCRRRLAASSTSEA